MTIRLLPITIATSLLLSACNPADTSSSNESKESPSPEPVSESAVEDSETTASAADYSSEWWFRTFGDETVIAESSTLALALNPEVLNHDHQLLAEFESKNGEATLKVTVDGDGDDQTEVIPLESEDYQALWQKVMDSGFLAKAMTGKISVSGVGVLLHGEAGPDELGWTLTSTMEEIEASEAPRRMMELLDETASASSELYRENR